MQNTSDATVARVMDVTSGALQSLRTVAAFALVGQQMGTDGAPQIVSMIDSCMSLLRLVTRDAGDQAISVLIEDHILKYGTRSAGNPAQRSSGQLVDDDTKHRIIHQLIAVLTRAKR